MSISAIPQMLLRRWYATILGLLITVALCLGAMTEVPPTYQSQANLLLLPPIDPKTPNPYLGLSGLQEVADVLARAMDSSETDDALRAQGASGKYTVARDTGTGAPILQIVASNKSGPQSLKTLRLIIAKMPSTFAQLQSEAASATAPKVTLTQLTIDEKPQAIRKGQLRAVIGAGVAGIVITLLLAALAENISSRRRRTRGHRQDRIARDSGSSSEARMDPDNPVQVMDQPDKPTPSRAASKGSRREARARLRVNEGPAAQRVRVGADERSAEDDRDRENESS